jgi:hypothetical protein
MQIGGMGRYSVDGGSIGMYKSNTRRARSSMDRASVFGTEGWGFESLRARQICPPMAFAIRFHR